MLKTCSVHATIAKPLHHCTENQIPNLPLFFLLIMNTDSSDWKRFIPTSDELNRIYKELETCMNAPSYEESEKAEPEPTDRSVDIFEDLDLHPKVSHVEQQLR